MGTDVFVDWVPCGGVVHPDVGVVNVVSALVFSS